MSCPSHTLKPDEKIMLPFRLRHTFLVLPVILVFFLWIPAGQAQEGTDPEKLKQGAMLFAENCAVCHGAAGQGRVGATLSKDWPSIRPDLRVGETIRNGIEDTFMPAWSQANGGPLDEVEIEALVYYILSWQSGGAPLIVPAPTVIPRPVLTPPPNVSGDPNNGAQVYDQNCLVCHGPNGEGRIGVTLAKDWPSIRPDMRVKSTIQRGISGTVMPAWDQQFGGPLSEAEINDLTAFILTWSVAATAPAAIEPTPTKVPAEIITGRQVIILLVILILAVAVGGIVGRLRRK